ncbi:MAG: hypothetical protein H5T86_08370 [Armatimonadetes bacterium]|nr:hypothetical protein [Armatimonadota bacterium]
MKPRGWVSHPDDVEELVDKWREDERVTVHEIPQYRGRPVYAIVIGDASRPAVVFDKPHAHEPAPCAAMMNAAAKLLTGRGLDDEPAPIDPEAVLEQVTVIFIPDANPDGTERAPVTWWDGTQYTNEEFWVWMRGLNPETGKMWERYDKWDIRTVEPKPATIGIVYEQISEYEYVEPNRHHDSSLFKLLFMLRDRYDCRLLASLHQTEFEGRTEDCMAILPIDYDDQPPEVQAFERAAGERMIEWWERWGGRPIKELKPLGYTGQQAEYLRRAWGTEFRDVARITSEVRNNSLLCPPSAQRRLSEAAIWACVEVLIDRLR